MDVQHHVYFHLLFSFFFSFPFFSFRDSTKCPVRVCVVNYSKHLTFQSFCPARVCPFRVDVQQRFSPSELPFSEVCLFSVSVIYSLGVTLAGNCLCKFDTVVFLQMFPETASLSSSRWSLWTLDVFSSRRFDQIYGLVFTLCLRQPILSSRVLVHAATLFIRTKTQSANFRGNPLCQATKCPYPSVVQCWMVVVVVKRRRDTGWMCVNM